jgi:hypothetical protein
MKRTKQGEKKLSKIELTVIKGKWTQVLEQLSANKLTSDAVMHISHFSNFMDKMCDDVHSINEIEHVLFSSEEDLRAIEEEDIDHLVKVSSPAYTDKYGESI